MRGSRRSWWSLQKSKKPGRSTPRSTSVGAAAHAMHSCARSSGSSPVPSPHWALGLKAKTAKKRLRTSHCCRRPSAVSSKMRCSVATLSPKLPRATPTRPASSDWRVTCCAWCLRSTSASTYTSPRRPISAIAKFTSAGLRGWFMGRSTARDRPSASLSCTMVSPVRRPARASTTYKRDSYTASRMSLVASAAVATCELTTSKSFCTIGSRAF
mmetsp:Transcript_15532/g.45428  ORF Transcript_15532/g.45428 Transcript_15532/m.45428 type:complete len:213 (+) Transcript_15532:381-1019(+)